MTDKKSLEKNDLALFWDACYWRDCERICGEQSDRMVFGRIAGLAAGGEEQVKTPRIEIHHFVVVIDTIANEFGILVFIFGVTKRTGSVADEINHRNVALCPARDLETLLQLFP
jgi:hypothetical protein